MRPVLCFLLLAACSRQPKVPQQLLDAGITAAPAIITRPAAVIFWLQDVDTLVTDSALAAVGDVTGEAHDLVDLFSGSDVEVYFTRASRIYVRGAAAPRRIVTLNGLDFPWGVVLIDPGYAEHILTGPVSSGDLRDLVYDYFGFEDEKPSGPIASGDRVMERFIDWVEGMMSEPSVVDR